MDPLVKDLYRLFIGSELNIMSKLKIFFHIRNNDTELCQYIKNGSVNYSAVITNYIGQVNQDIP